MKLKMKTGLSGPTMSLAPGDPYPCDDEDEAQRLIDAGFAEPATDEAAPVSETAAERVARLKSELKIADADLKAEIAAAKAAAAAKTEG